MSDLYSVQDVSKMIEEGRTLILAGDETLLKKLPEGNWIAGTIPYFMTKNGGSYSADHIFVTDISSLAEETAIKTYNKDSIPQIIEDSFENGFTFLILPALTDVLKKYALEAPEWKNLYINPVVGWISGVKYEDFGQIKPLTFAGSKPCSTCAVAMHVKIPSNKVARVEIVNIYEQGDGDDIYFEEKGFGNNQCIINGEKQDLYQYLNKHKIDETLPLVANYAGANINVGSIWNKEKKRADLFAPVFPDVPYRVARHRNRDYQSEFKNNLNNNDCQKTIFSCNCLFNYFNFNLEGKNIANISGPFTFGEIAYHVLNQTFVYLVID